MFNAVQKGYLCCKILIFVTYCAAYKTERPFSLICTRNCIKYAKMVYGNSGTSLYSLEDSDRLACHFSDPFYS